MKGTERGHIHPRPSEHHDQEQQNCNGDSARDSDKIVDRRVSPYTAIKSGNPKYDGGDCRQPERPFNERVRTDVIIRGPNAEIYRDQIRQAGHDDIVTECDQTSSRYAMKHGHAVLTLVLNMCTVVRRQCGQTLVHVIGRLPPRVTAERAGIDLQRLG